ncbi:MAG: hypothetical protein U0269_31830 [Polyangiales bacterium]
MNAALRSLATLAALGSIACDGQLVLDDAATRPDRVALIADATMDSANDGAVSPSCRVIPVAGSLTVDPTAPVERGALRLTASNAQPLTNVELELCAATGSRALSLTGLDAAGSPVRWWWDTIANPAGEMQAIFRADPDRTVYATREFVVRAASDAGPPVDAMSAGDAGGHSDLCAAPSGNLLGARGSFETGLVGNAPAGWEVRNPAMIASCDRSGAASQHVFLTSPAPGCEGRALAVDSRGQWDCYAVQTVSDYNSIVGGRRYRVTASVRSTGNAPRGATCPECAAAWFVLGAQWLDAADQFFGDEKNPRPASAADNDYDWRVLQWDLVAPPNARRVLLWLSAHYPGRVDFDNVSIVALP